MGADMYIQKLPRELQYTGYRTDLGVGYYRAAYNNSNFLWQFELSFWEDIAEKYCVKDKEEGSIMPVAKAEELLQVLQDREPIFEKNMQDLLDKKNKVWDYETDYKTDVKTYKPDEKMSDKDRADWVKAYRDDYAEFKAFLNKAIAEKSGIICSL